MRLITILGPTAVGKTKLAVRIATELDGEIISADSRQVYKNMDIGTGKDLQDFYHNNQKVPYHLIDIKSAGEKYDVFHFQKDFYTAYKEIAKKNKQPVLCGGTGLYLQAALDEKAFNFVPVNEELRKELKSYGQEELNKRLRHLTAKLHNQTDLTDRERTIRAIEIVQYERDFPNTAENSPVKEHLVIGLQMDRERLRARIAERMEDRFNNGMIEEVKALLESGVDAKTLDYYGHEYRYILSYLQGDLSIVAMKEKLLQEIRRFAKKQMTWYRRMEKRGVSIHWLSAENGIEANTQQALSLIKE